MKKFPYSNFVRHMPSAGIVSGGRVGTLRATRAEIVATFGEPHWFLETKEKYDPRWGVVDDCTMVCASSERTIKMMDDKVTTMWVFSTPRGPVNLRDYWSNASDEWSIAAPNRKSALWLASYLRFLGLTQVWATKSRL